MNPIAAVGGAVGGVILLVLVLAGGAGVGNSEPPRGGCAISPPEGKHTPGSPAGHQEQAELTAQQMAAARTIVAVGKGMGVAERGTAIALGTAMQESTLNPQAASGRSLGLFQQLGGLYADVRRDDPADASRAFYEQLLARVPQYADSNAISFADAAQEVQRSGAGAQWYARWEQWATQLAAQLYFGAPHQPGGGAAGAVTCAAGGGSGPVQVTLHDTVVEVPSQHLTLPFPNAQAARAAAAALSYVGTPYAWGGGDANGPTRGIRDGGVADAHGDYAKVGFDCAGLTLYAYAQTGIALTRPSSSQLANAAVTAPWSQVKPGDLLFWGTHHVALYLGSPGGQPLMVEAPQSGDVVKISPVRTGGDFQPTVARPAP